MQQAAKIQALAQVGAFVNTYFETPEALHTPAQQGFAQQLQLAQIQNPWFTADNLALALQQWGQLLTSNHLSHWLAAYHQPKSAQKIGLILAGNIPMVGWHDVLCVLLSGHHALIKLSSKDKILIPFLLKLWAEFLGENLAYTLVERLEDYDAVIATGSNSTAQYLAQYFKHKPHIIRQNRTSVAVLKGQEHAQDLELLAKDIFSYFGLGCRNVTHLLLPKDMKLDPIFEAFVGYSDIINHHKYANNYDYQRAIMLLNKDLFWDNNFVILNENPKLFSPLAVVNFSRYDALNDAQDFLKLHENDIQCVVSASVDIPDALPLGQSQHPALDTYADGVDVMLFLQDLV
jgi:Acyl-CoA reductase (LuxC)